MTKLQILTRKSGSWSPGHKQELFVTQIWIIIDQLSSQSNFVEEDDIVTVWWNTSDLNTDVFTSELWEDGGSAGNSTQSIGNKSQKFE